MGDTKIEWCDKVWNPITGCTPVSAGCERCYAERMSKRLGGRYGYSKDTPFRVSLHPDRLNEPLGWKKPRRIFVCSMGDLFHKDVPFDFILKVFDRMQRCPQHTFLVLTKRPERMMDFCATYGIGAVNEWPQNVQAGVSVEDQATADERIPLLLQTPADKRFVSIEPMLGPVDIERFLGLMETDACYPGVCAFCGEYDPADGTHKCVDPKLDGVILGGESGPKARPMHTDWPRKVRDDCKAAGVPFFFKSHGEWAPVHELRVNEPGIVGKTWHNFDPDNSVCRVGKKAAGHLLDGVEHREIAE